MRAASRDTNEGRTYNEREGYHGEVPITTPSPPLQQQRTKATYEGRDNLAQQTHLVFGAHLGEQEVGVRDPDPLVQAAPLRLSTLQYQRRPRWVAVGSLERRISLFAHDGSVSNSLVDYLVDSAVLLPDKGCRNRSFIL